MPLALHKKYKNLADFVLNANMDWYSRWKVTLYRELIAEADPKKICLVNERAA